MNALDLHILSSSYGRLSNVIAEAIMGYTCITTDVGDSAYVGKTGWIVPSKTSKIAKAIEKALMNWELLME